MDEHPLNKSIRERIAAGVAVTGFMIDDEMRSVMVQILEIDAMGNKKLQVLGRSPLVIGLN